ncbi:helix-turn-helix domain-containing protein [Litorilituus sediminis]|uniref:XRE family transcriptional regulator n=1 Tax=Litorilituus sediminis TaxID=718192 RepID=A0A4P6P0Q6_9GAMM|nr:helix-turn-helix domain-containing protein [Litorilituus sediminis]QBG34503.1 XRE family transcriptional regulator [Litorilituus sediminis]
MSNPISDGIKSLRNQHKLTQTKLAELAGIPRATLANMESAQSNPSISLVVKVAQALGVSVDDLISKHPAAHVTEVERADMPVLHLDDGKFSSTKASPISTQNLQINDISMMPSCYCKGVPHPEGSHELFLCLDGIATVEVQGVKYQVEAGNLIYFHGHLPHCYGNEGVKPVHAVAVVYMA